MNTRRLLISTSALLVVIALAVPYLRAQSLTQGAVSGTVTDPSGAVVPGAQITLTNGATGRAQTTTTTNAGAYNLPLLPPGTYTLSVTAASYQNVKRTVYVSVGQSTTSDVQLALAATQQTVEVTAEGGVVQTVSPDISTTMSDQLIALAPNGGGDLSYIAQTAPGSSMNTQNGFGNFSSFGLPANTNNFTVNSMPENDPFLSINNSGATNILLGQNDVSEATVVTNGYQGQYSMAGANVNYVSKSGTNAWHGNANWRWNGDYVNANNYFNNQSSPPTPRPFVNDNMWQGSIGGPIQKDKTFIFGDTEGLYLTVPVSQTINIPTPAFATAVQNHIAAVNPSESALYASMFNFWMNAPNAAGATPNTGGDGGCTADFVGTAGFGGANPCTATLHSSVSGRTHEWLITARVDHNFSEKDQAFLHFRMDRGVQASYTDPLSPIFNLTSYQPQYEGQIQETHTFGTATVNSFSLNGNYYRAIFPPNPAALAVQPVQVAFVGGSSSAGSLYTIGHDYQFPSPSPQGRNVTEYGFVDDVSHTVGNHALKFGGNFARYDITDYGPGAGTLPAVFGETFTDFYNGVSSNYTQSFPTRLTQPIALYNLGFYGQDTWKVRKNLNLTLTLRADRNSNPTCRTNCFSRLNNDFFSINHDVNTPYNQSILPNQSLALPGSFHPWTVEPRFGFNFSPNGDSVISGGFGIFTSPFPAVIVDSLFTNLPNAPAFTLSGLPFGPTTPGNSQSAAAAAASALQSGFGAGDNWATLNAAVLGATGGLTGFSPPNFFNPANNLHTPRAQEWDLQFQQSFGTKMAFTLKYVGNHVLWEQINNAGVNAFCGTTAQLPVTAPAGTTGCLETLGFTSFAGLPPTPIDPRFLTVTEASTGYNSNYNGLTATFQRRFSSFQFQVNYTWSHALDFVSNAGVTTTPFNANTNGSILSPQNPFLPFQNMYGNSDYDVRHYLSVNYVYTTPKNLLHGFVGGVLAGWTIGGTIFARTGLPFTVIDSATGSTLNSFGYGTTNPSYLGTFANQIGGGVLTCGSQFANPVNGPCPSVANNFVSDVNGFGNQRRNQVYGPHFFNTDLSISKEFHIPHWESGVISIGATAYNLFNHPNFDQPIGDVGTGTSNGTIISNVNPPTSIYGSGLGADASPRLLQSQIKLTF